jgi:hypothetical protein
VSAEEESERSMWAFPDGSGEPIPGTALCGLHEAHRSEVNRVALVIGARVLSGRRAFDGHPALACTTCGYRQHEARKAAQR